MEPDDPYQQTLQMDREIGAWHDPENLIELYWEKNLTLEGIADKVGVSVTTVHRKMKYHGLPTRGPGPRTKLSTFRTNLDGGEEASGSHRTISIHRLIMIAEYGLAAVQNRDVHHQTKIPFDNRDESLQLMSHSEHTRLHNMIEKLPNSQATLYKFCPNSEDKPHTIGFWTS